jgi:hypothetical protein
MIGEMALKKMNLFIQNMEPNIPNNGGEKIPNYIMCGSAFYPTSATKYVYP